MSSAVNQQHTFPAAPPSLSAGDHEMRDYYAPQGLPEPAINQTPYLTPYLGLRARLSQIWINRWTILLLLVLVRTLIAVANLDDNLDSARAKALSACTSVENMGSAMASMPHYMSQGVNELTASGVEKAVNGLYSMLDLSVTGVEEIVVFIINVLTSTYVCLITLAVSGSLHAAVELAQEVTGFLNETLGDIGGSIEKGVSGFQSTLNSFLGKLNSIPFVGNSPPKLDISGDLAKLKDLKLPAGIQDDLTNLKNNIPDFKTVNNFTNNLIRTPFEEIKKLINESMDAYQFDRSVFPVPAKEQLSFCSESNGINDFFDGLSDLAHTARKVFIGVVVVLAVLVCIPMAWREIRRYRLMRRNAQLATKEGTDPMDIVYIASRPYTSSFGIKLANRFSSPRRQVLVRWAIAYATSTPALFVLSLGIAGLFACLCQYILLKTVEKEVPALTDQVSAFAEKIVFALNNASESWANGTNAAITATNNDINQKVFGWVNTSTTAVNDTLNEFVDGMSDVLNKTFGGTILYEPIKEVLNCLINLKIEGIQKGLTWVHENAHVKFPLLSNDTFSLGAVASISNESSTFLASPNSKAKDEITEVIVSLTNKIESGIREEAIISTCICLIWLAIVVIGCVRAGISLADQGKTRAEGGQAYVTDPVTDSHHVRDITRPKSAAPPYEYPVNKAAPYTITPRPFPTFGPSSNPGAANEEKVGSVGAHSVGEVLTQPSHYRSSSHGHVGGSSPSDEKSGHNLFTK